MCWIPATFQMIENCMVCSGLLEIKGGKSNGILLAFENHPEMK
jgi:hypothetical protein